MMMKVGSKVQLICDHKSERHLPCTNAITVMLGEKTYKSIPSLLYFPKLSQQQQQLNSKQQQEEEIINQPDHQINLFILLNTTGPRDTIADTRSTILISGDVGH